MTLSHKPHTTAVAAAVAVAVAATVAVGDSQAVRPLGSRQRGVERCGGSVSAPVRRLLVRHPQTKGEAAVLEACMEAVLM